MKTARKLALITGASSGIGLELAKVFASNNYNLLVVADSNKINDAAKSLRSYNVEVHSLVADLATKEGIDAVYSKISALGILDVAALNAGVGVGGEFVNTNFEDEVNMINLNVVYLVGLTKLILKDMTLRNSGKILFTSSIAAEMPGPYYACYAATKAFVQSFVEAIRFELKDTKKNIVITALQPGATDTNFFARANMLNTKAGQGKKDDPATVAQQGYDALMRDQDYVVGGNALNKVQSAIAKFVTEEAAAGMQAKDVKPLDLEYGKEK